MLFLDVWGRSMVSILDDSSVDLNRNESEVFTLDVSSDNMKDVLWSLKAKGCFA